jgi:three-Cys-motif partner protein
MQVEWETIEAVAATKAIDLWLLFPLGIGVNRLLKSSGTAASVPAAWQRRLDLLLGTTSWREELYEQQPRLIDDVERVIKLPVDAIGRYFNDRLASVFAGVAKPGVLKNSADNPLYLLCFAAANEKGAPTALRIANSLLKDVR